MLKAKGHLKIFRVTSLFAILISAASLNLFVERSSYAEMTDEKRAAFEACMQMDININPQTEDEKKEADEQADAIVECVKNADLTEQEAMVECGDSKYIGRGVDLDTASKNRVRCDAIEGIRVRTTPKDENGEDEKEAVALSDQDVDPCYAANEALSWFTCPLIDGLSTFMTRLYTSIIEDWLNFDPQILTMSTNATTGANAARDAWGQFRIYANVFFVIVLFFMIFAQFTGFGEGRYNFRAMLPRFLALVLVVNISYPICQMAVDLSNILGSGISNLFIEFSSHIELENAEGVAGASILASVIAAVLIAAVAIIIASIAVGPAFLMPIIMALLGGMLTVFFTYLMLVVRQAVMVILVVVSPVAIALSILPGTKSIFDKWFKLFRGLLLTYPIASLLVMGGNFAARLVMKVWNGESFIMSVVSMAICIVPVTMLPKVTRSTLTALDGLALKAQGGITKFAGNRLNESRFANNANAVKAEKAQRRRSFTYRGKDGNLHTLGDGIADSRLARRFLSDDKRTALRGRLNSMRTADMDRNLAGAQKSNSALNRFGSYSDPGMIASRDEAKRISEQGEIQQSQDANSQSAELERMTNILSGTNNADQTQAAVQHLLSQGEAGRSVLMQALSSNGISTDNQMAAAQAIMQSGFGEMESQNARLANWARDMVTSGNAAAVGRIDNYQLSGAALRRMTGRKLESQDTSEIQYLEGRANAIRTRTAAEFTSGATPAQIADLDAGAASIQSAARAYAASESFKNATNVKRASIDRMR